jgi:hypothetical protein
MDIFAKRHLGNLAEVSIFMILKMRLAKVVVAIIAVPSR